MISLCYAPHAHPRGTRMPMRLVERGSQVSYLHNLLYQSYYAAWRIAYVHRCHDCSATLYQGEGVHPRHARVRTRCGCLQPLVDTTCLIRTLSMLGLFACMRRVACIITTARLRRAQIIPTQATTHHRLEAYIRKSSCHIHNSRHKGRATLLHINRN